ncbi:MAG TPA: sugar transferase [Chloroflexia bacterium]|nr:sugar transferase [Chloroflexia bacterium]
MASIEPREFPQDGGRFAPPAIPPTREFAHLSRLLTARVHAADRDEQQRAQRRAWGRLRLAIRLGLDAALLNGAFALAYWARYSVGFLRDVAPEFQQPLEAFWAAQVLFTALGIAVFYSRGVYAQPRGTSGFDQVTRIASCGLITIGLVLLTLLVFSPTLPSRLFFAFLWGGLVAIFGAERYAVRRLRMVLWTRGINEYRVIVVGATAAGQRVMRQIVSRPAMGYRLIGYVDDRRAERRWCVPFRADQRPRHLGNVDDLYGLLATGDVDELIIALGSTRRHDLARLLAHCDRGHVRYRLVPDLLEMRFDHTEIETLDGLPLIGRKDPALRGGRRVVKRLMDVLLGSTVLIAATPVMLLIALLIGLEAPRGPILFRQTRAGRGGTVFTCYKFRSMRPDAEQIRAQLRTQNEADGPIFKMRHDPRVTRVGRWLRKTSLDELPQLFNILRGDMSFVGPRPPVPAEVMAYTDWHLQRLEVTPGLTGLWQVSGRSNLTFEEMVTLDLYYVENWSLLLDCKLLLQTVPAVLFARGAY